MSKGNRGKGGMRSKPPSQFVRDAERRRQLARLARREELMRAEEVRKRLTGG